MALYYLKWHKNSNHMKWNREKNIFTFTVLVIFLHVFLNIDVHFLYFRANSIISADLLKPHITSAAPYFFVHKKEREKRNQKFLIWDTRDACKLEVQEGELTSWPLVWSACLAHYWSPTSQFFSFLLCYLS